MKRNHVHSGNTTLNTGDEHSAIAIVRRENDPGCYLFKDWRLDTDLPDSAIIPEELHWKYFIAYYLSPKLVRLGYPIAKWGIEDIKEYESCTTDDIFCQLDTDNFNEDFYCLVYRGTAIAVETIAAFLLIVQTRFGGFKTLYGYKDPIEIDPVKPQEKQLEIDLGYPTKTYQWKVDLNEDEKAKKKKNE